MKGKKKVFPPKGPYEPDKYIVWRFTSGNMAIQFGEGGKKLNILLKDGSRIIHPDIERVGTAFYYIFSGNLEKVGEFEKETLDEVVHVLRQTLDWDTRLAKMASQPAPKQKNTTRQRKKISRSTK